MLMAQTTREGVEVFLACIVFGWLTGVPGMVIAMLKANRGPALTFAFLAVASSMYSGFYLLGGHDFSLVKTLSAIIRHWPTALITFLPLLFGAVTVGLVFFSRRRSN